MQKSLVVGAQGPNLLRVKLGKMRKPLHFSILTSTRNSACRPPTLFDDQAELERDSFFVRTARTRV